MTGDVYSHTFNQQLLSICVKYHSIGNMFMNTLSVLLICCLNKFLRWLERKQKISSLNPSSVLNVIEKSNFITYRRRYNSSWLLLQNLIWVTVIALLHILFLKYVSIDKAWRNILDSDCSLLVACLMSICSVLVANVYPY